MVTKTDCLLGALSFAIGAALAVCRHADDFKTAPPSAAGTASLTPNQTAAITSSDGEKLLTAPPDADEKTLAALIEKELLKTDPDALRLEAVFMRWFDRAGDLASSSVYRDLLAKYPTHSTALAWSFHTAWAWHDCDAAFARVQKDRPEAWPAVWTVACALGHPAAARPAPFRQAQDMTPAQRLARRNPSQVRSLMEAATKDLTSMNDDGFWQAVLRGWAESDPGALLEYVSETRSPTSPSGIQSALLWLRQDPAALEKMSQGTRQKLEQNPNFRCLTGLPPVQKWDKIAGYADDDFCLILDRLDPCMTPAEFLQAVIRASPPDPEREPNFFPWAHSASSSTPSWDSIAPAWTLDSVMTLQESPYRDAFARMVLRYWGYSDYESAARYAREHGLPPPRPPEPSDPQSRLSLSGMGELLAASSEAAEAARSSSASDREFKTLRTSLAEALYQNPESTLQWIARTMSQLPNEGQKKLLPLTSDAMKTVDLSAATAWASQLPSGPLRDAAVHGMMPGLSHYDPMAALSWAASTSEPETSFESVLNDLTNSIGKAGAPILIRNSSLPPAFKEFLLNKLSNP